MRHTSVRCFAGGPTVIHSPASGVVTFCDRVFALVATIPDGHVTTWGTIARALAHPRGARVAGWAMRAATAEAEPPRRRVADRLGRLSGGWYFGYPDIMANRLRDEGIPLVEPYRVDLAACPWEPAGEADRDLLDFEQAAGAHRP